VNATGCNKYEDVAQHLDAIKATLDDTYVA
jgi:hypothetical protein